MSNYYLSANMSLPIPAVGIDPGPDYALNQNSAFTLVDAHDHSSGKGVQITPAGININADLSFTANNAINLRSVRLSPQGSVLSGATDLGCLYEVGVDLYYNDGSGNHVRITQSGGVAGSPGSIANLTSPASASYVSGTSTFVWQSAANTSANMDFGSAILRNNTANSFGLTLSAPAALASNYSITLPTLPASTLPLRMDTAGNIGTGQIQTAQIANGAVTTTQIAGQTIAQGNLAVRATGSTVAAGGFATSSTITATVSTAGLTLLSSTSITITSTGRPIVVGIGSVGGLSLGGSSPGAFSANTGTNTTVALNLGVAIYNSTTATVVGYWAANTGVGAPNTSSKTPVNLGIPAAFEGNDFQGAGTYTYQIYVTASYSNYPSAGVTNISATGSSVQLYAYES